MKRFLKYFLMMTISLLSFFSSAGKSPVIKTSQYLLKVGDDVRLRSGGPAMTIEAIQKKRVRCSFLNKRYEYTLEDFDAESLELLEIEVPEEYNIDSHNSFVRILSQLILLQYSLESEG